MKTGCADHGTSNRRSQRGASARQKLSTSPGRSKHQSRPDTGFQDKRWTASRSFGSKTLPQERDPRISAILSFQMVKFVQKQSRPVILDQFWKKNSLKTRLILRSTLLEEHFLSQSPQTGSELKIGQQNELRLISIFTACFGFFSKQDLISREPK